MDGNTRVTGKAKNYLTDEEAAQYTVKNVMGGSDSWQPTLMCEACLPPVVAVDDSRLVWQPVPYAICYVVTRDGQVVGFTTDCTFDAATSGNYQVQAVNEYGGLSQKTAPVNPTAIQTPRTSHLAPLTTQTYNLGGSRTAGLRKGLNIVRTADGTVRKIMH